jgi:hypothetical protein
MGYELEIPHRDFSASDRDLRRYERAVLEAGRQLGEAIAQSRQLRGLLSPDDPISLAQQIRIAHARQRWREAADALAEVVVDED